MFTLSDEALVLGRRELVLVITVLAAAARPVGGDAAFLVAGLLPLVTVLSGLGVVGREGSRARSIEALLIPAVLAGGTAAAIHLVPLGLGLVAALVVFAVAFDRVLVLELRLLVQQVAASEGDRARVVLGAVVAAFVAFTGVAALVPNGLVEPAISAASPLAAGEADRGLSASWLIVLAVADAGVGLVLGYRLASFRYGTAVDAARSALTYAIVVAVAAGAIRAMDLPRLVGPALLTLVFYLWDALHGTAPARRREPRFLWETILLVVLGVVVVAWNLRLET